MGFLEAVASLKALYRSAGADRNEDEGAGEVEALEEAVLRQQPQSLEEATLILDVVVQNMGCGPRSDELDIFATRRVRDFLAAQTMSAAPARSAAA